MAKVLGLSEKPIGIKQSDVVAIERKATEEDLAKAEENKQKEKDAFKIFKEKVAYHKLDMKLITVHFLIDEPKDRPPYPSFYDGPVRFCSASLPCTRSHHRA